MCVHKITDVYGCCGFHTSTQNLLNAFKTDPVTGLPMANFNAANYSAATDYLDPRVDWTFARSGIPFFDWGPHQPSWARNVGYTGFYNPKKSTFHKGQLKSLSTASGWSNWPNAIDIAIMRYSDILLMAAECEIETNGNLVLANTYINMVRTRAGKYVQGAGTNEATISQQLALPVAGIVTDLVNGTKYKIGLYPAFANQTEARNALRFERRLELAMEGYRFFDLVRWNIAETVLNSFWTTETFGVFQGTLPFTANKKLYPIPAVEIELSRIDGVAQLKQNPGY